MEVCIYIIIHIQDFGIDLSSRCNHGAWNCDREFIPLVDSLVWRWFAITTQFGRRENMNRLLKNGAASLHTLDISIPDKVVEVPPQFIFGICEIPSTEHPNNASSNSDEQRLGPFYNYARLRTWSYFARSVLIAFKDVQTNRDQGADLSDVRNSALTKLRYWDLFA